MVAPLHRWVAIETGKIAVMAQSKEDVGEGPASASTARAATANLNPEAHEMGRVAAALVVVQ
jgi:hypothetical protein